MLQGAADPWEQCSGQTRAPTSRLAFPSRSSLLPPTLPLISEGSIPGKACPLNHITILIYMIISSAVCSQREEISYKPSPKIPIQAQSNAERKVVFAEKDGASVAKVDSPVTDVAVDFSVM